MPYPDRYHRRLTAGFIRTAPRGLHPDGACLWLDSKQYGRYYWTKFWIGRRQRAFSLGPIDDLTLTEARSVTAQLRELARQGDVELVRRVRDRLVADILREKRGARYAA